jgi:Na+/melibiose symporter-like transporter
MRSICGPGDSAHDKFDRKCTAANTLTLVVGIGSALFDPIMGILADRTKTRWGRFLPWILGTAVLFGIVAVLAFIAPAFTPSGKLLCAYITFTLLLAVAPRQDPVWL